MNNTLYHDTPVVSVVLAAIRYRRARALLDQATTGCQMQPGSVALFDAAIEAERVLFGAVDRLPVAIARAIDNTVEAGRKHV